MHRPFTGGFIDDGAHLIPMEKRSVFPLLGGKHQNGRETESNNEEETMFHDRLPTKVV